MGGEASLRYVTDWIGDRVDLTERELSDSGHHGRPRYANTLRATVRAMVANGQRIAFHSDRHGHFEIYVMNVE